MRCIDGGRRVSTRLVENRLSLAECISKAPDGQGVFVIRCQFEVLGVVVDRCSDTIEPFQEISAITEFQRSLR